VKRIRLRPRGAFVAPPRSDTLFGLLASAVRAVSGRASVERFLAPALESPPRAPLYLSSCFPFLDADGGSVFFMPVPGGAGFIEATELVSWLAVGGAVPTPSGATDGLLAVDRDRDLAPRASLRRGGFYFLASGPHEHYLESALRYLERTGFGGGASRGLSQFEVGIDEVEFVRLAQPGETGVLLSLLAPTSDEAAAIATAADDDPRVTWRLERRQGAAGPFAGAHGPGKSALAMITEGSIVPRGANASFGCAPRVGTGRDGDHEFPLLHGGFGFLLPLAAEATP
jgi:CRISPR/Cas system CSM-associated protein Csm4 (group 5 of RAMP superfamily)